MPEPDATDPRTQEPPAPEGAKGAAAEVTADPPPLEAGAPDPPPGGAVAPAQPVAAPALPAPAPPPGPSIADDRERSLDPRYVELEKLIGLIITAVVAVGTVMQGIILGAASLFGRTPWWVTILISLLTASLTVASWRFFSWWPEMSHRHHAYRVGPRGIEIRHGVWWRAVVSVPRSRVQHTDVSQGPLERRFGLATLRIHTAGTEQAEVLLPGLDREVALAIRDHLVAGGEDDAV